MKVVRLGCERRERFLGVVNGGGDFFTMVKCFVYVLIPKRWLGVFVGWDQSGLGLQILKYYRRWNSALEFYQEKAGMLLQRIYKSDWKAIDCIALSRSSLNTYHDMVCQLGPMHSGNLILVSWVLGLCTMQSQQINVQHVKAFNHSYEAKR